MAIFNGYPYTTNAYIIGSGSKKPEKKVNLSQKAIHNFYKLYWPIIWYNKDSNKYIITENVLSEKEINTKNYRWLSEKELNLFLENS